MAHGSLSSVEARFFRDQGFFRLPECFTRTETRMLRDFVHEEVQRVTEPADISNPNRKLYGLYDLNESLMQSVVGNSALVGALVSILGPNIVFVKNRHNHATINSNMGVPAEGLHRDILQPNRGLVTAALYLQDSTELNGATRIVPGSHNLDYVGVPQKNGGGTWMAEHDEFNGFDDQSLPVPMGEGGVLLFNGALFHGVGQNYSGDPRMSLTLGYRSVDELDFYPDKNRSILVAGEYIYRGNDV